MLAARARAATGSAQAMPIYEIWNRWDLDDPNVVANTLAVLGEDGALGPAARMLALSFSVSAKLRLGDTGTARAFAAKAGYVARWLTLGPFDHEGRSGFAPELQPETDRGRQP